MGNVRAAERFVVFASASKKIKEIISNSSNGPNSGNKPCFSGPRAGPTVDSEPERRRRHERVASKTNKSRNIGRRVTRREMGLHIGCSGQTSSLAYNSSSFSSQYCNDLGKMKLTAPKTSIRRVVATAALSRADNGKRRPTNGRIDPGALVGVGVASVEAVSMEGAVVAGKGTRSCKSGKKESRDDYELHIGPRFAGH